MDHIGLVFGTPHMDIPPQIFSICRCNRWVFSPPLDVNGDNYQVCRIAHVRFSEGQYEDFTAVLSMGCIKWNIDDVAS